jgi:superfamily II DNA helicase RecQ
MLPSFAAAVAEHPDEQTMLKSGKLTIVVCPLLALLRDQQTRCEEMGLNVARWDSSTPAYEVIERQLRSGALDILLTTPER